MEDLRYLKHFSVSELKKVGVTLIYEEDHIFSCDKCGQIWQVLLKEGGILPNNYWTRPNECNDPERKEQYSGNSPKNRFLGKLTVVPSTPLSD